MKTITGALKRLIYSRCETDTVAVNVFYFASDLFSSSKNKKTCVYKYTGNLSIIQLLYLEIQINDDS